MRRRSAEIAEPDQLDVGSVGEGNECVVRDAIGVLSAWGHGEAAAAVVVNGRLEIAEDEDHMVQPAEHGE